ncbi:hypothetical protein B0H15DRAFT_759923, partial [Mycena belliarum]
MSLVQTAAAAASFSMYALNANGLVNSAKLHHINNVIRARNPHSFVLTESKTNSKVGANLPNHEYTIFEEPGVQAENHHLYKWGVVLGIRKGIQIAQRVQITSAHLRGRVIAVDVVLQTNNGEDFYHRIIGGYAPWDPGTPATCEFWPELTKLIRSTSTSWTCGGDLNATVSAAERLSGGLEARRQYTDFLAATAGHDIWTNNPNRNRKYDWTSRADGDADSGNIIDRAVTSKRSYVDAEISAADLLNKPRIKYPTRMEKHRHDDFRMEINKKLDTAQLDDVQVNDDHSFLDIYDSFTDILIPAAELCYGRVTRWSPKSDERVMSPTIEKLVSRLHFIGGAIRTIRDSDAPNMAHGTRLVYYQLAQDFYSSGADGQSFLQYAQAEKRKMNRQLFAERVAEIRARRERQDRYRITAALKGGSTKRLVTPGEFIEMPVTVKDLHSEKLISDPDGVKETSRQYWSNLYHHDPSPNIPKPWLATKSVIAIKQRVSDNPFLWPRQASLSDFRALLRKGTPRPAPGRDQWEKWLVKSLPDRALEIVLKLHNYIVMNSRFPGDLKDMWLTMFHKRGLRTDLSNWRGLLLSNFLANSPMSWLNYNLVEVFALKRDQMKGFDYLAPQGMYDAVEAYGLPSAIIDLDRAAQTD